MLEILFQIEAIDQEVMDLFKNDPDSAIGALLDLMRGSQP